MLKTSSTPTKLLLIKAPYLSKSSERLLTATHNLYIFLMATQKWSPHKTGSGAGISPSFPIARCELKVKEFNLSVGARI